MATTIQIPPVPEAFAVEYERAKEMHDAAAIYARVSTTSQELEGQKRDLLLEASRLGMRIVREYEEKVSATGKVERKEYDRLLKDTNDPDRGWTHLIVWALDRFTREERFTRAVDAVLDLEAKGIVFHFLKDPMLNTPADGMSSMTRDFLLALLPIIAKYEAIRRRERTQVAMNEIKAGRRRTRSGKPPGRPVRVTEDKLARIMELRKKGLTWPKIAGRVGLPAGTCAAAYSLKRRGLWKPRPLRTVTPDGEAASPESTDRMPKVGT